MEEEKNPNPEENLDNLEEKPSTSEENLDNLEEKPSTSEENLDNIIDSVKNSDDTILNSMENSPQADSLVSYEIDNLSMIQDVLMDFSVILGDAKIPIKDILELQTHSVLELDRFLNDPVDIYLNDRLFAKGQILSIDEEYAVKVVDILSPFDQDDYLENFS